jgi:hypothetical protein
MKVYADVSKKSAVCIFNVDSDIPDTPYHTEEKLKLDIRKSYTAAETRAAFLCITCGDKPQSTSLW